MQPAAHCDWIVAICSVVFDLDVGQQLESVYPPDALSEPTASAVAFHSFPVSGEQTAMLLQQCAALATSCDLANCSR